MQLCRRFLACVLIAVTCGATSSAQAERALLYPGNNVSLNDNSIQAMSAVQSGDKIHTGNSEAQLTARNLLALIDKESTLHYGEDLMILDCGAVVVSSSTTGVQGSDTTVMPVNGTAKFRMENRRGRLKVEVQAGSVRVSNDQRNILTAGQSVERESNDGCPVAGAYKPPSTSGSTGRLKAAGLILGGGTAVGAGIWFGGAEARPVSASRPD
jgi:hypothetical protein